MKTALSGLRVVDVSESIAGQFCSKHYWMHGADVTIIEPSGGSLVRGIDVTRTEKGLPRSQRLFVHLNAGKALKQVGTDITNEEVDQAIKAADVIISSEATTQSFLPDVLGEAAIQVHISEFPEGGPYAKWVGGEIVHQAFSGAMQLTGHGDRRPIFGLGHRAYFAAGVTAYSTSLAALFHRYQGGRGQRVAISVFETCAAMAQNVSTVFNYNGHEVERARYPGMLAILRAKDAWLVMFGLRNWEAVCETFDAPELADDPRFADPLARVRNWHEAIEILADKAAGLVADEVVDRGQRIKVSIEKVHEVADLRDTEQLKTRGVFVEGDEGIALAAPFRDVKEGRGRVSTDRAKLLQGGGS